MYEYRCVIKRIVDGDTVDVDIDLGFGVWMHKERVRLLGIDTPESRTRDLEEKKFGLIAKEYVKAHMPVGSTQTIRTQKDKTGKFGRILGDFVLEDGKVLTQDMLENHMAVEYFGNSKDEIKAKHLENRTILIENGVVQ